MRDVGRLARFKNYDAEPSRTIGLGPMHPAVVEGRTLFPNTVVTTFKSQRFLVPAENSAKIGRVIEKGAWAGFPVFTLTLQERATCPRTCHMWQGCFGNAMQWARRNDVDDPDFIPALKAEMITLIREVCSTSPNKPKATPPKGIVVRLHVLGDFYSHAYVQAWAEMMEKLPEIHVFGYTARHVDDPESWEIAAGIEHLNRLYPDRWVIRTSHTEPGRGHTIVVDEDPHLENVIMCPSQTKASETCATCALCWNQTAIGKTIGFMRHGIKISRRRSEDKSVELHEELLSIANDDGVFQASVAGLIEITSLNAVAVRHGLRTLIDAKKLRMVRPGHRGLASAYQVFRDSQTTWPALPVLSPPPRRPNSHITSRDPQVSTRAMPVAERQPDAPLMQRQHAHKRGGWGQLQIGSADQFDIGTAEERIAAVSEEEKARIAAQYGAKVVKKEAP